MQSNDIQQANAVLVFENVEFDVVDIHNIPWLRGLQVATALAYQNPAQDFKNLYSRNADEFDETMTDVVELNTAGGRQPVRIFSPRGSYLLAMLARTDKAKAFRRWVLDVLEGKTLPRSVAPLTVNQQLALLRQRQSLCEKMTKPMPALTLKALHADFRHVSTLLGLPFFSYEEIKGLFP